MSDATKPTIAPFDVGTGDRTALLLHGLTGTPWDMRPIGDALAAAGMRAVAPVLRGHDDLDILEHTTWNQWYADIERRLDELLAQSSACVVVGFSMGSLLALRLAALRGADLAGVVAISVPLDLPRWQVHAIDWLARLRRLPVLGRFVGRKQKRGGIDVRVRRHAETSPSLKAFPYPALEQLVSLQAEVSSLLERVDRPLLLLHGGLDHAAATDDSARVAQRVASADVRRVVLPRSFHLLPRDLDSDRACAEIVDFARRVTTPQPIHDVAR